MITAQNIMRQIDEALTMFGEYTYGDKGAEEVMDVDGITTELRAMSNDDILAVLKEVESKHRNPDPLLTAVAGRLINIEEGIDPKMDELAKDPFWDEYF